MTFQSTKLHGVFEIHLDPIIDTRGFFARSWCQQEFQQQRLNSQLAQCSISLNARKGTLRGMHYQMEPFPEAKIVRCTHGSIYDVVIDLRPLSPTFMQWVGVVLSRVKRNMIYVPEQCAHGFLTLEDETEVFYQISEFYHPELACGVRWDDPAFKISWPEEVQVISERDRTLPWFKP